RAYPELGAPENVAADLIHAEFAARRHAGAPADLAEFARRFPLQEEELGRMIQTEPTAARPELPAPGTIPQRFGRYRTLRKLGHGGMGSVYLAHHTRLDRQVALKVPRLTTEDDPEALERFEREAKALAALHHPNLCPVYDAGLIENVPYLTMAYLDG